MEYNNNNIFAKIIRKEIPCNLIAENEWAISFYDINPIAEFHALVIPKNKYISLTDFTEKSTLEENKGLWNLVNQVANQFGLNETGFRLITNNGRDAKQEVPHFHVHMLGKQSLPNML